MALTNFQRTVCRLLADHRIASGESATALNELIAAPRVSMDIDLFHDSDEALAGDIAFLRTALLCGKVVFHPGRIRGAMPEIKS